MKRNFILLYWANERKFWFRLPTVPQFCLRAHCDSSDKPIHHTDSRSGSKHSLRMRGAESWKNIGFKARLLRVIKQIMFPCLLI
jgi:hypothetical protein